MVLESLSSDRVNITDLVLEEPREEFTVFDPRKDIGPTDLEKIKNSYWYKDLVSGQTTRITNTEKAALICFPKEVNPGMLNLNQLMIRLEELKKEHISGVGAYMDWDKTLEQASSIKILFPQTDPDILITNQDWEVIKECVEDIRHSYESTKRLMPNSVNDGEYGGYEGEHYHIGWLRIFFQYGGWIHKILPSKVVELGLNLPEYWQAGRGILENNRREEYWDRFFNSAPDLKILFPDQIHSVALTKDDWARIREYFLKSNSRLLMAPDILEFQAKEFRVTDQGIEIIMPKSQKPFTESNLPLPQKRKF